VTYNSEPSGERVRPARLSNPASRPVPSCFPCRLVPAKLVTVPPGVTLKICVNVAAYRFPDASTSSAVTFPIDATGVTTPPGVDL
jgi:hypothetical protein